jgi:pyridoxal phosphate enzyme (YggS family)
MSIADAIRKIEKGLPKHCVLVAVSKTKPNSALIEAYNTGQLDFGENKVQEIAAKSEALPKDIRWHFIGHLQTNKVKFIIPFVHLIHGVDSLKLLSEIDKRAKNAGRIVDCLLQLSIADEETKFGFSDDELLELISSRGFRELSFVNIRGMMGMATYTDDQGKIRKEFRHLRQVFEKASATLDKPDFNILSMGMTNDYQIALEEGSNMIRIGSLIFGERGK